MNILLILTCILTFGVIYTAYRKPRNNIYHTYTASYNPYPIITTLQFRVRPIFEFFGKGVDIILPSNNGRSYTVNKRFIYINIYKIGGEIHSIQDLVEVCLHELAHVLCTGCRDTVSHSPEYHNYFRMVIEKAVEMGIMDNSSCVFDSECFIATK